MKLHQMFRNVLSFDLEALVVKVEEDSIKRHTALEADMQKIVTSAKPKSTSTRLTPEEKALLKALGFTMKDVKMLAQGGSADG